MSGCCAARLRIPAGAFGGGRQPIGSVDEPGAVVEKIMIVLRAVEDAR